MNGFQVTKPYKVKRVYNQYHLRKDLVEEVFQGFRLYKDKQISMREISVLSNIPTDRLYCWYRKWTNNRDYRPGSQYGKHKRLFTDVQEKAVADFLRIQYVIPGILVRRKHLRYIIRNLWQQYHPEAPLSTKNRVSHHFLRDFCARHKLGFRKPRKKKRSDIKEEEVEQYAREYAEVIAIYPHERILNMDETPLNLLSTKTEVLAEVGTEEVNGQLPGDPKQNFTVICTITASGEKLPPVFLAQGKTPLCHQQFSGISSTEPYEILHSPAGFTNEQVMIDYLRLVNRWMNGRLTVLVLDRYSAHVTTEVKEEAGRNNIRLVFVPTSGTDKYQPLDKRVFGVIKSKYASKCDDQLFEFDNGPDKSKAADLFLDCWKELSEQTILSAWDLDESSSEEEGDTDDYILDYSGNEEEDDKLRGEIDEEELILTNKQMKEPLTPPRHWLK